ncbi:sigma-54-dependent transcriptional regulator [Denitratisoma oestradiolicum]|uniref:Fused response regulator of ato opeon, in two-component system with AtoS: response regulator sigma54 interaction protein n=1 Tax=Denitratisoma oestradiolicum TaxID=311182 RepID=A0A6S6XXT7_9PROT|nr:sigma-54 dependent transcriptional regulator [Denitratisoma oestradiolicum]CAB1369155.1 fused response regulator of ato opeon, in two-component system with AtoS: response regulator; sigma54 interaction protein [Denitratisoma oestradiolicum]
MSALLIVEDDTTIRVTVGNFLARLGYSVDVAENAASALKQSRGRRYRLILLDLHLPDGDGLDLIGKFRELDDDTLVVIMTAFPEVRTAVAALKAGAYDYITKPFDLEDVRELIGRAMETSRLRHEVAWRRAQSDVCQVDSIGGESPAWQRLTEVTQKIAGADHVPVLICGESGSGKERVARTIHCGSPRAGGPWVTLNCSALPENLLESEMFGYEKGAFTDARQLKRGLLELADGGTLFLDEIGDLALTLQPKLLRVLETQTFRRLGGSREISVDVRFVAATHRNLPEMVKNGQFREDLYYRLNVGAIEVPPLRARREDILPLARYFLTEAARAVGSPTLALAPALESMLESYAWPGNVRELRNVLERAAILCAEDTVTTLQLPREIVGCCAALAVPSEQSDQPFLDLAAMEQHYIQRVLDSVGGNKTRAAELLGITRLTLRNKLKHQDRDDSPVTS